MSAVVNHFLLPTRIHRPIVDKCFEMVNKTCPTVLWSAISSSVAANSSGSSCSSSSSTTGSDFMPEASSWAWSSCLSFTKGLIGSLIAEWSGGLMMTRGTWPPLSLPEDALAELIMDTARLKGAATCRLPFASKRQKTPNILIWALRNVLVKLYPYWWGLNNFEKQTNCDSSSLLRF